jgi:hypothetical protein
MAATTTLAQLDGFLRDIWLECCGHLSQFSIDGVDYSQDDDSVWGPKPKSMKTALNKVLRVGDSFDYEYDFGSTTELAGVVLAERQGVSAEPIAILARNNPPEAECSVCKKKAEVVCPCCEQCFCESCFGKDAHFDECDEWEPLPLVNSPRAGVCGYTGNPSADPFTVPA